MERNNLSSDKYLRLVYCMIETCSKSARRLILFYLEKNRPVDLNGGEWTIDDFLYENRERLPKLNPSQHKILFPGRNDDTDMNKWDISLLFIVLEMFNLDSVISKDSLAIKKTRNRIFHAASTSIEDVKYEGYKEKISVYVQNCCTILDDQTLASEIEDIFKEAEGTKMNKETQTRVMSDFDNWFKSEQLFDCNDKIPSEIGSMMDALFENIVNLLGQFRYEIPDAYLSLQISSCSLAKSEEISKQILQFMSANISPQENESRLGKAISTAKSALIDKHRKLVEVRRGCLILRIRSEDFQGFWCLISDCIGGKLTSSWRDVQNMLREEHGAPYLTIEVGVTASEIISCVEELIQNISEGIDNQLQKSLSTKHAILDEQTPKHHKEGNEQGSKEKTDCDDDEEVRSSRSCRSENEHDDYGVYNDMKGESQDTTTKHKINQLKKVYRRFAWNIPRWVKKPKASDDSDTLPHAPYNVSVEPKLHSATLRWIPAYSSTPQYFFIWYRSIVNHIPSKPQEMLVEPQNTTGFTLYNLEPDTLYEFKVKARNELGSGQYSDIVQTRTLCNNY